jgi:hypothetical protein
MPGSCKKDIGIGDGFAAGIVAYKTVDRSRDRALCSYLGNGICLLSCLNRRVALEQSDCYGY